jgi:hypothetical protein
MLRLSSLRDDLQTSASSSATPCVHLPVRNNATSLGQCGSVGRRKSVSKDNAYGPSLRDEVRAMIGRCCFVCTALLGRQWLGIAEML